MVVLAENNYGKSRVRLVHVKRHPEHHDLREWTIDISLEGDFESCFVDGNNSKILPTDTMKNTVYSLARCSSATCMEDFAQELIAHFLDQNPQVTRARVAISEKPWEHLLAGTGPHPTTFVQSSGELQITDVDYSETAQRAVARYFFDREAIPPKAWDGGYFYSLFYGLFAANARYVMHFDGDMMFGGGSKTWMQEAIAWLNRYERFAPRPASTRRSSPFR